MLWLTLLHKFEAIYVPSQLYRDQFNKFVRQWVTSFFNFVVPSVPILLDVTVPSIDQSVYLVPYDSKSVSHQTLHQQLLFIQTCLLICCIWKMHDFHLSNCDDLMLKRLFVIVVQLRLHILLSLYCIGRWNWFIFFAAFHNSLFFVHYISWFPWQLGNWQNQIISTGCTQGAFCQSLIVTS